MDYTRFYKSHDVLINLMMLLGTPTIIIKGNAPHPDLHKAFSHPSSIIYADNDSNFEAFPRAPFDKEDLKKITHSFLSSHSVISEIALLEAHEENKIPKEEGSSC